jgi:hypothetical protein
MKTYPYMDGDQLIQLVERREYDELAELALKLANLRAEDMATIKEQTLMIEKLANARLIAAAPDLLEALECIASATCEKWEMPYVDFKEQFMPWARNIALATLAKAKGKQP